MAWVVRTKVEPRTLIKPIEKELADVSGGLALAPIRTMDEIVSALHGQSGFQHAGAHHLRRHGAASGRDRNLRPDGVSVEQRTQEIGIRLALGAEYGDVRNMIIFQGMRLALIGVIIGVASSFALTKLIASLLYGVQARDPLVFIGMPVLLSVVALTGSLASRPARDARQSDGRAAV